ncbi:MAG: winged helix-turn-helix transcriptional regulator [Bacteroidetes bacterium]|nr:winged helix-turn-helix transcriptional regulator [Bacteroidota bacterium]
MGVTKTSLYSKQANTIAQAAKVIGHPARVSILLHLLKKDQCINSDLVDELGLSQATISQHLRELKNSGLIKGSIEGVRVNYCIDAQKWMEVKDLFQTLFDQFGNPGIKNCC